MLRRFVALLGCSPPIPGLPVGRPESSTPLNDHAVWPRRGIGAAGAASTVVDVIGARAVAPRTVRRCATTPRTVTYAEFGSRVNARRGN